MNTIATITMSQPVLQKELIKVWINWSERARHLDRPVRTLCFLDYPGCLRWVRSQCHFKTFACKTLASAFFKTGFIVSDNGNTTLFVHPSLSFVDKLRQSTDSTLHILFTQIWLIFFLFLYFILLLFLQSLNSEVAFHNPSFLLLIAPPPHNPPKVYSEDTSQKIWIAPSPLLHHCKSLLRGRSPPCTPIPPWMGDCYLNTIINLGGISLDRTLNAKRMTVIRASCNKTDS